mgnify:CR=1 FL=1
MPRKRQKTYVLCHHVSIPLRCFFTIGIAMKRAIGLRIRIWKLMLTVGCFENIITKSIIPANPIAGMRMASVSHKFLLQKYSMRLTPIIIIAMTIAKARGEGKESGMAEAATSFGMMYSSWLTSFLGEALLVPIVVLLASSVLVSIVALLKSCSRFSGKNCCSLMLVGRSACMPSKRSLPNCDHLLLKVLEWQSSRKDGYSLVAELYFIFPSIFAAIRSRAFVVQLL